MLMQTFLFILGIAVALLTTPIIRFVALRFNFVDPPSRRKVHNKAIPRLGGIGIYLGVFISIFLAMLLFRDVRHIVIKEHTFIWFVAGSTVAFLLGLWDDIRRLNPTVKFAVQAIAAIIAYWGGIGIFQIELPWGVVISLGVFSLPITVFWFLLVINAINLIDGLDGLAAGVSLFAALTLLITSLLGTQLTVSFFLAALAGSCIGFLRYNFNPASIFMGDGGSYFLGYSLAALSILGSMKSQATVSILIPLLALGLPLLDTLFAPVRRFLLGKHLFQPDKSHIHHRLLKQGLSHRNAVLVLYGATIVFGAMALIDVLAKNEYVGLTLLFFVGIVFFGIRKLGYLEYLASDKIIGYFRDITDDIGLKKDRRTFLGRQKAIREAVTPDEMWDSIIDALQLIDVDYAEIRLDGNGVTLNQPCNFIWRKTQEQLDVMYKAQNNKMSVVLPLVNHRNHGSLLIEKDVKRAPLCEFTLRRVEQLRRSIVDRLTQFESEAIQMQSGKLYCMPERKITINENDKSKINQSDVVESDSQSEHNRVVGLPN